MLLARALGALSVGPNVGDTGTESFGGFQVKAIHAYQPKGSLILKLREKRIGSWNDLFFIVPLGVVHIHQLREYRFMRSVFGGVLG